MVEGKSQLALLPSVLVYFRNWRYIAFLKATNSTI
jgi:hypothetical protein